MERFERLGYFIKEKEGFIEIPTMILIVHEVPSNPCSERIVIQKWFKDNGIIIKEFKKDKSVSELKNQAINDRREKEKTKTNDKILVFKKPEVKDIKAA